MSFEHFNTTDQIMKKVILVAKQMRCNSDNRREFIYRDFDPQIEEEIFSVLEDI